MNRWNVCKRDGRWRVYDHTTWHDSYDTLPEAHTAAAQYAVMDELCAPGGLRRLKVLQVLAGHRGRFW